MFNIALLAGKFEVISENTRSIKQFLCSKPAAPVQNSENNIVIFSKEHQLTGKKDLEKPKRSSIASYFSNSQSTVNGCDTKMYNVCETASWTNTASSREAEVHNSSLQSKQTDKNIASYFGSYLTNNDRLIDSPKGSPFVQCEGLDNVSGAGVPSSPHTARLAGSKIISEDCATTRVSDSESQDEDGRHQGGSNIELSPSTDALPIKPTTGVDISQRDTALNICHSIGTVADNECCSGLAAHTELVQREQYIYQGVLSEDRPNPSSAMSSTSSGTEPNGEPFASDVSRQSTAEQTVDACPGSHNLDSIDVMKCEKCGQSILVWEMPEHLDFHFAMELQEGDITRPVSNKRKLSGRRNNKKRSHLDGAHTLRNYFQGT